MTEAAEWEDWGAPDETRFNAHAIGRMAVRREGAKGCRLRMWPEQRHANLLDTVHGGAILSLVDVSLFAAVKINGGDAARAVTLELSSQFIGAGKLGQPLDAVVEVLRETRRLVFLRGTVVQGPDDELVVAFSGIVRKAS